jgi:hypothetical protein
MILVLLLAALVSCDPVLTALFTPLRPVLGRYEVCTSEEPLDRVAADTAGAPVFSPGELMDPLDAFGAAGSYSRSALAQLFTGRRVRVARGWVAEGDRFESITLLSPYPDGTLTRLLPGTMIIRWTMVRP